MARATNNWEELAQAVSDLSRLTGVTVTAYLDFKRDVMCCKVAGNSVEVTRKELEERSFVNLYDALKLAMTKAGLENPEQFLVKPSTPPSEVTATDIAMRQEYEQQRLQAMQQMQQLTRKAIDDNQYRYLGLATLKNEGEPVAISLVELRNELLPGLQSVTGRSRRRTSVPGFDAPSPFGPVSEPEPREREVVTWREPREVPELELGEPDEISKMDVLMQEPISEPAAPDLIMDGEETSHGTGKKVA